MKITDVINENPVLAKGLQALANLAPTAAKTAPKVAGSASRVVELFSRHRANIAQIEQLSTDPRALPQVIQRLKQLHGDLYDIAHFNSKNTRIVGEVNRLRDDLAPVIRNMEVNANSPGAASVLLQSTRQELVPVLKSRLQKLQELM